VPHTAQVRTGSLLGVDDPSANICPTKPAMTAERPHAWQAVTSPATDGPCVHVKQLGDFVRPE